MTERHRPVTAEESAAILRLHHAEQWPVGHHRLADGVPVPVRCSFSRQFRAESVMASGASPLAVGLA